jgi:hypothetical protein
MPLLSFGRACPLCGGSDSYRVWDIVSYDAFSKAPPAEWLHVRRPMSVVPALPSHIAPRAFTTELPGLAKDKPKHANEDRTHRRCTTCHSLLPPQFWRTVDVTSTNFALAVIGYAAVGKTTWLTEMFTPPQNNTFEMIRPSRNLGAKSYDYAEPYTLELLRDMRGARTVIPWTLLGTTVSYNEQRVMIRTLDIRGEHLLTSDPASREIITRHLTLRKGRSALLVVDRFEPHTVTPAQLPIGQVFQNLTTDVPGVWSGVAWTYLDTAQWNADAENWLKKHLPNDYGPLSALANLQPQTGVDLYPAWQPVFEKVTNSVVRALLQAVTDTSQLKGFLTGPAPKPARSWFGKSSQPPADPMAVPNVFPAGAPTGPSLDGLIALLFRLQIAYSLKAGLFPRGKDEFFREMQGYVYCSAISDLARKLYCIWDRSRGALGALLNASPDIRVFPCGMVHGASEVSVWSDSILLEATEKAIP